MPPIRLTAPSRAAKAPRAPRGAVTATAGTAAAPPTPGTTSDTTTDTPEPAPGDAAALASRASYPDIDFTPPKGVREACARGVELYEEGHGGDGLVAATVTWARRLARGEDATPTDRSYNPHGTPRNTAPTDGGPPDPKHPRQVPAPEVRPHPADPRTRSAPIDAPRQHPPVSTPRGGTPRHPGLVGAPLPAGTVDDGSAAGVAGDAAQPSAGYVPTPTTEAAQDVLDAQGAAAEARRLERLRTRAGEALGIPPEDGGTFGSLDAVGTLADGAAGDVGLQEAMADESLAPVTDSDGRISPYAETVRRDDPEVAENLANAGLLDPTPVVAPTHGNGVAVVLTIPAEVAEGLTVPQGLPASELHVTLLYLGKRDEQPDGRGPDLAATLRTLAAGLVPPELRVAGVGRFLGGVDASDVTRPDCLYLAIDSADLEATRAAVMAACATVGAFNASEHGFTPHMTVAYVAPGVERPDIRPRDVAFDAAGLALWWGTERYVFPFRRSAAGGDAYEDLATAPLSPHTPAPPGSLSTGGVSMSATAPGDTAEGHPAAAPASPPVSGAASAPDCTPPSTDSIDLPEGAVLPFRVVPLDVRGDSMAYTEGLPWNREHAIGRLRAWASSDGTGAWETVDLTRYCRAFAYVDSPRTSSGGRVRYAASGFRFPHHDVHAGKLTLSRVGLLRACAAVMRAMEAASAPALPPPSPLPTPQGPGAPMLPSAGAAGPTNPDAAVAPRTVPPHAFRGTDTSRPVALRDLPALGYPAPHTAPHALGAMAPEVRPIPSSGDAAGAPPATVPDTRPDPHPATPPGAAPDTDTPYDPAPGGIPMSDLEATRDHLARHCDQLGVTPPWRMTVVRPTEATEMRADFTAPATRLDARAEGGAVTMVPGATLGPEVVAVSWIQVARQGEFKGHSAGHFRFTPEVFREIIANFNGTANRAVPVDYEHTTERMDGSIPIHGAPAVGFFTALETRGSGDAMTLWGKVEWVDATAVEYVRSKKYRFFSPAVVFDSTHPASGKDIGATLVSGGLTNRPFLDGMAPITARAVATHQPPLQPRDREALDGDGTPAAWDGDAAERDLRKWASAGGTGAKVDMDWGRYREGFAWYDADAPEDFGSYKLPHHAVIDGALRTSRRGVEAAIAALNGARGGVSIPADEREAVYRHLANHYKLWDGEAPALMALTVEAVSCRVTPADLDRYGVAVMVASARAYLDPAAASERVALIASLAAERLGVTGTSPTGTPTGTPTATPGSTSPAVAQGAGAAPVVTASADAGTNSATTMRDTTGTAKSDRSVRLRAAVSAFRAGERTALMRWYDGIDDAEDVLEALRCYLNLPNLAPADEIRDALSRLADLVSGDMGEGAGLKEEVTHIVGCLRRALNLPALALPSDVVGYVMAAVDAAEGGEGGAPMPPPAFVAGTQYMTEMRAKWMARKAAMQAPGGNVGHDGAGAGGGDDDDDDEEEDAAKRVDEGMGSDAMRLDAGGMGPSPSAVHVDGPMNAATHPLSPNTMTSGARSATTRGATPMSNTTPKTLDPAALAAENAALRARLDAFDRRDAEATVDNLIACGFIPAAGRAGAVSLRLSAGPEAFAAMYPADAVTMRTQAPSTVTAATAEALMAPAGSVAMRSEAPSPGTAGATQAAPMTREAARAAIALRAAAIRKADPTLDARAAFETASREIAEQGHHVI